MEEVLNLTPFLFSNIYIFKLINFLVKTALAASHKYENIYILLYIYYSNIL